MTDYMPVMMDGLQNAGITKPMVMGVPDGGWAFVVDVKTFDLDEAMPIFYSILKCIDPDFEKGTMDLRGFDSDGGITSHDHVKIDLGKKK